MKICFIFSNFHLHHITGQAGLVDKLAKRVKEKSYKVSVISNYSKYTRFTKNGIGYYLIKGLGDFKTYFLNFFRVIGFLKKIQPDVIHVNGVLMTIYVWLISRFLRIPFFSLVTETLDHINSIYKKLYAVSVKNCRHIFVTAEFLKRQLVEIGVEKNKITVVRIGLDENYLRNYSSDKEIADILYFGDSNQDRGFDRVVKLARKMRTLKFLISIRYQYDDCKKELETAKKLPNIRILFYPYKESLSALLARSKLIILPYRWMLIRPPISLLEAMAIGKCVMTTPMPGNEEIIQNNINGIITDFSDIDKTSETIMFLNKNKKERDRIGEAARKTIREKYSLKEYSKIMHYYALIKS